MLPTRMPRSKSIHSGRNASPVGSSAARPSVFVNGSQSLLDGDRRKDALEDHPAVCAAEDGFAGAFRVRHEAEDVAFLVADTGNVAHGAVGVVENIFFVRIFFLLCVLRSSCPGQAASA